MTLRVSAAPGNLPGGGFVRGTIPVLLAALFACLPALRALSANATPSPSPVHADMKSGSHAANAKPSPSPGPGPKPLKAAPVSHPPRPPAPQPDAGKSKPQNPDEWNEARRLFDQLSPDQKKKFIDNLDQWKSMPRYEQDLLRDRELYRNQKMAQEIQDALNKSGLRLSEDQREVYALRYTQERRKIEDALRREMDQKRQTMVSDMLDRLKVEFSQPSPAAQ